MSEKTTRRNLLRDYYGLSNAGPVSSSLEKPIVVPSDSHGKDDIDSETFDVDEAIEGLRDANIYALLQRENELVAEIRQLDSDRKSLVYDNYSRLITAMETIRKMRQTLYTLRPESSSLVSSMDKISSLTTKVEIDPPPGSYALDFARFHTLNRIMQLPIVLSRLVAIGRRRDAEMLWGRLEGRLSGPGIASIREQCRKIMLEEDDEAELEERSRI